MTVHTRITRGCLSCVACASALLLAAGPAQAGEDDFPPFEKVSEDYTKVVTMPDGRGLWTIYRRDKDAQLLAELPGGYAGQKLFIATSVSAGGRDTAFQWSDMYVYWKRIGNRLALIEPNYHVRSTGDAESQSSISRTYSDRVILDVPIVTMGPGGGPVIDLDALLLGRSGDFFRGYLAGARMHLATITETKVFPHNVEIAFELPRASGQFTTVHYSISVLPGSTGSYQPRTADQRIGYFTTVHRDMSKLNSDDQWVRYVNRWHIEKRDPSLRLSPPKEPIIFYIEHTTPVRYRRWVREGILEWNKAFEKIGILDAIEVYYQDAETNAHMEKDPEDVRYNFIRWVTSDLGYAFGPSRVDPRTGQILDADIVMDDSWLGYFIYVYERYVTQLAEEAFSPETLAWLEHHPKWDPRLDLVSPLERERLLSERAMRLARHGGAAPYAHPLAGTDAAVMGDGPFDGLVGRHSQLNGMCNCARARATDIALMRALSSDVCLQILHLDQEDNGDGDGDEDDGDGEEKEEVAMLDGLPEDFVGPLLADVITHEVGHTLGLMHNFKASSIYTLEQINSPQWDGKPISGSTMDYNAMNYNVGAGEVQGPWTMTGIGPYDYWVIEYGYTFDQDLESILDRCAEPELAYGNDIDAFGPDPLCRQHDLGADPLNYLDNRIRLTNLLRSKILDAVQDGESWDKVRTLYQMTLNIQTSTLGKAAIWIGGSHIHRDHKGDPGERDPIEPVSVAQQRRALQFMIDNAFDDEAFGLSHELLNKMGIDKWWDAGGFQSLFEDDAFPIHQRIAGIQSMALTLTMDPFRLGQVYDNEFRIPADQDAITLPEILFGVADAVWSELDETPAGPYTVRRPMISSLRRNLQSVHIERLVDLAKPGTAYGPAARPITNLAVFKLRDLKDKIGNLLDDGSASALDPYTLAHLSDAHALIEKALDAQYIYNTGDFSGGGFSFLFQPTPEAESAD
ncbi:MAG: zinc-dependent metalloprotease [Phycisphaerales bacterium]|nr:zinc-dependent metalloprotease [Phycisphaerales bacterium]